jgi:hypothetical protein
MAKLKDDPITAKELAEFVNHKSDFAFEMQVLSQLRSLGFECSHSATYQDPVTTKIRQYDIRAVKNEGQNTLALAVECKNLRPNCPILLSAVPRTKAESFHALVDYNPNPKIIIQLSIREAINSESAYKIGCSVAKKIDQVGKDSTGAWLSNDKATFEKVNQAVNSSRDLILECPMRQTSKANRRVIVPLLVVPTGLLWQVDFTADGKQEGPPRVVERSALYLDHAWQVEGNVRERLSYRLSHIEFATLGALPEVVRDYFGTEGFFR